MLEFTVEADGRVENVRIISATSDCFANAAWRAISRWCYWPKVVDGRPVRSERIRVTIQYVPE